jgi:hypothetical protein
VHCVGCISWSANLLLRACRHSPAQHTSLVLQMHSEFKVRVSALGSCPHIVVPLHVICSSEGGCCITYPYAGRSMDRVCADLRDAGQHDKLATQLAEMACAVVLTLQKFQAVKPKVGQPNAVACCFTCPGEICAAVECLLSACVQDSCHQCIPAGSCGPAHQHTLAKAGPGPEFLLCWPCRKLQNAGPNHVRNFLQ